MSLSHILSSGGGRGGDIDMPLCPEILPSFYTQGAVCLISLLKTRALAFQRAQLPVSTSLRSFSSPQDTGALPSLLGAGSATHPDHGLT